MISETMRSRAGFWLALSLLLFAPLTTLGCGPGEDEAPASGAATDDDAGEPVRGGTLVVGSIADIEGVNETIVTSSRAFSNVGYQLFLHLLEEQPDFEEHPPTYAPSLAESYEWSDDHLKLTFRLRDDIVWSDGEPITAEDVRFTWQAQTHPDVAWNDAYLKDPIEDVEVVDPRTVVFHYNQVGPSQLADTVEGVILPKHAWGKLPFSEWRTSSDFFTENLVVSGPYTLESWTPQQEVVLVRNDRYRSPDGNEDLPYIDRVVFRMIPERSNQVAQLLAGTLHVVVQVPNPDLERVEQSDIAEIEAYYHRLYAHIAWNLESPLFEDRAVRQALTLAIDRQEIVDTLWGEYGRVSDSPVVQNVWAHDDSLEPWPYDPERAKELLAEAGWTDSDGDGVIDKDGRPFRFEMISNQGNDDRLNAMVMMKEHLRRVGIELEPRTMEFNAMYGKLFGRDFEAVLSAWGVPTTLGQRYAFHSASIEDGENFSSYRNPRVDALIEEMEKKPEIAEAEEILHEIQQLIHEDQPMTFLWESQRIIGHNHRLHGLNPNPLGTFWFLDHAWLEPPG